MPQKVYKTLHECAVRFGNSQRTVTAVLDRHGVPRRPGAAPHTSGA